MRYIEPITGKTYTTARPRWRGEGGSYLNLTDAPGLKRDQIARDRYSVWRYAAAIGVDDAQPVTLGEGWTPLVMREWAGADVLFKLEFMMTTGSFKDRGMTVMVS